jgi:hypothetical protein
MANSKKIYLLITILLIIGLVLSANKVLIDAYRYHYRDNYLAAIVEKNNLLASTPSPKIIIVGGSNAAFGFDSQAISEATGMPVVNMGIQGSIGLRFALNDIKPYIHSGDIVLLSPEYHNLVDKLHGGDVLSYVLIFDPKGIASISSLHDAYEVVKAFPAVHTSAIKTTLDLKLRKKCDFLCRIDEQVYFREAFDPATGDITTNLAKPDTLGDSKFTFDWSVPNKTLEHNVSFLNDYNEYVESQGASMIYIYPSISNDFSAEVMAKLESTSQYLNENLDFPVLGTLDDSFFAERYMFDTVYHLNNIGREIRTKTVIRDLCAMLNDQCTIQP